MPHKVTKYKYKYKILCEYQTIQKKVYIKEQNVVNQVITTDTSETIQQKCICMFCMKQDVPNSNCVKFDKLKYDTNNYLMQELIQKYEHLDIDANFICMKCDSYLKTGNIPVQLFTICDINVNKCFFCEKFPKDKQEITKTISLNK